MRTLIIVGILAVSCAVYLYCLSRLQEHRLKDRPLRIGESFSWIVDVFRASDYTDAGRKALPWYIAAFVGMVISFLAAFILT
jgi:hypothetical protein